MSSDAIILNSLNFVGKKVRLETEKIDKNINAKSIIIKNSDITNDLIKKISLLKNLKEIWLINCDILGKMDIQGIETFRINQCNNIKEITLNNSLKSLHVNNCNQFDIKWLEKTSLKTLELEYLKIENFSLIENMKTLETLSLKEIDLRDAKLNNLTFLKNLILNGSIVKDKEQVIKYFLENGVKIEFLEKNFPIG